MPEVESPKIEHVWVAIVTYKLTEAQARTAYSDEQPVPLLETERVGAAGPVCIVCEQPYADVAGRECAGDPGVTIGTD